MRAVIEAYARCGRQATDAIFLLGLRDRQGLEVLCYISTIFLPPLKGLCVCVCKPLFPICSDVRKKHVLAHGIIGTHPPGFSSFFLGVSTNRGGVGADKTGSFGSVRA